MSFWRGLGRAMESNEQQRNVEQAREDRQAELAKADERFNMQWKNTIAQQDRTNARNTLLDDRNEERYVTSEGRLDAKDEAGRAAAKAAGIQATKEWDQKMAEWDYSKSRDVVADLKVAREESTAALQQIFKNDLDLHGRDIADANLALNEKKFEEKVRRSGVTDEQWELSHQFQVDQADQAQGNWETKFNYDKDQTSIAQVAEALALEVAAAERLYGKEEDAKDRDQWQKNMDLKIDTFKNGLTQQGLTQSNWERAFTRQGEQQDLDQENVMFGRKVKMLEMSAGMTNAFGGQGGSTKGSKAPASSDMGAAVINIKSELGGKQGIDALPPESRDFFDKVLGDPAAAYGVYGFIQAQRKEGNKIAVTDLPKYINLAGMVEAQGDPEAGERLRAEIMGSNPDISNIDALFDGMKEAAAYKPASLVWGILQTPKDAAGHSADLKLFNDALQNRASATFAGMDKGHPEYSMYKEAIHDLGSSEAIVKARGSAKLFDIMGAGLAEEMGVEDNPALSMQFTESKARQEAARQEEQIRMSDQAGAMGDGVSSIEGPPRFGDDEVSGMDTPQEYTMEEAESFMIRNPDFVGKMYVNGELLSNEPDASGASVSRPDTEVSMEAPQGMEAPSLDAVPVEVQEAVKSVISAGDLSEIEEAAAEIAAEFGKDVAGILFDNVKSERGTGKAAMMDGLQTPSDSSPEVAEEGGYTPPTMGATELNTPAIREAIAKVPTEVTAAIDSVVEAGDPAEIEEAKQEIAAEFGEEVAMALFDDAKSKRGTGKTAIMDGLQ